MSKLSIADNTNTLSPLLPNEICRHTSATIVCCTIFAISLSILFVLNLYILVPSRIRKLPRSNSLHIRWRTFGTACTILLSIVVYPMLFCKNQVGGKAHVDNGDVSLWVILGWRWSHLTLTPLKHVLILYFGPIVASALRLHIASLNRMHCEGDKISASLLSSLNVYIHELVNRIRYRFSPFSIDRSHDEWSALLRDLAIAPLAEEMIFRSCIVPPFLFSLTTTHQYRFSVTQISWITPLFFGMAHIHHAIRILQQPQPPHINEVLFSTTFQFIYTTLFGAYASYVFVKTASLPGVVVVHSFCNWMGFPNLYELLDVNVGIENSYGYRILPHDNLKYVWVVRWYRKIVWVAFGVGIVGFWFGFGFGEWFRIFPKEAFLRQFVSGE